MKKFVRHLSLSVSLSLLFVSIFAIQLPVKATNQHDYLSITPVIQAKTNWCWAASGEMMGKNICPTSTWTQYDLVHYIKSTVGSEPYPNEGGTLSDCVDAVSWASQGKKI